MVTQGSVLLVHAGGLHARPAVALTKLAKTFQAMVLIATSLDGPWLDAKSVVKVMGMRTPAQSTLHFRATGNDAQAAVGALIKLVESDFSGATI